MLRIHLSNHHLTTTGAKAVMAQRVFNAFYTSSNITTASSPPVTLPSITTPNPGSLSGNILPSSTSLPASTLPGAINPAQLSTLLQLLKQTLQQNPSVLTQQTPASNLLLPQPSISLTTMFLAPTFSAAQHGPATTLPTTFTLMILLLHAHKRPTKMHYSLHQIFHYQQLLHLANILICQCPSHFHQFHWQFSNGFLKVSLLTLTHYYHCNHYPLYKCLPFHYTIYMNQFLLFLTRCLECLHCYNSGTEPISSIRTIWIPMPYPFSQQAFQHASLVELRCAI